MTVRICHTFAETPWGPLQLLQNGADNFTVAYGKQIDRHLNYTEAAQECGSAIMHWLACEGKLDNRLKDEH